MDQLEFYKDRILQIDEHGENLTTWEINFIAGFVERICSGDFNRLSEKQKDQIDRIFDKRV